MIDWSFAIHKNIIRLLIVAGLLVCASAGFAQESGKELFQQRCTACHSIGGGRLVGPDLAGVGDRRPEGWLLKFIKSPQALLRSGDKEAVALFEEFNGIVMPDQTLSDSQIRGILDYIKEAEGSLLPAKTKTDEGGETTQDEIGRGRDLFQGKIRFVNNGPSCISCHHVKNDAVIGGGILAKDLTTVFSRMGGEGVRAILGGPPFPVMQAAYKEMPFTDDEIRALVGFLQQADKEHAYQQPRDYGWGLFGAGIVGTIGLFGFYGAIGKRRKKRSVNQDIYDRQIKSE